MASTMLLDDTVVKAFNMFPKDKMSPRDSKCLLGVLNKCRTNNGQELLRKWLRNPLADLAAISEYAWLWGKY